MFRTWPEEVVKKVAEESRLRDYNSDEVIIRDSCKLHWIIFVVKVKSWDCEEGEVTMVTVAHYCQGKTISLTAKRKTSRQKGKDSRQKEKPCGKKKNLTAKRKTSKQKEKDSRQKEKDSRQNLFDVERTF